MEYYISNGELHHWGIKGMRWGQRRYQNKDGSLTPAGRKRYEKEMERLKAEKRKIRNEKATANKLAKLDAMRKQVDDLKKGKAKEKPETPEEAEKRKAEYEAERQRVIKSGTAEEALKFKNDLKKSEMDEIKNRLQWEKDMNDFAKEGRDATAKRFFDKVGKYTTYAEKTAKAYNFVANVINAFSDNPVPLPKIDLDITKGNKDDRLAKKKAKEENDAKDAANKAKQDAEKAKAKAEQAAKNKMAREEAKQAKKDSKDESKALKDAQKQVDEYNKNWYENDEKARANAKTEYSMSGKDIYDSKYDTKVAREVVPEMPLLAAPATSLPVAQIDSGRNYIAGLLEAPKNR